MARVARDYLRYITGNVDTYPGGMTAKLRRAWGFNNLLPATSNGEEKIAMTTAIMRLMHW